MLLKDDDEMQAKVQEKLGRQTADGFVNMVGA